MNIATVTIMSLWFSVTLFLVAFALMLTTTKKERNIYFALVFLEVLDMAFYGLYTGDNTTLMMVKGAITLSARIVLWGFLINHINESLKSRKKIDAYINKNKNN